ncbi:Pimeloyl-ACP methyl ester carboxylesterase [Marinobacter persicus]|uniref:Pimeloyl-ACP methyl ester carboxylesterase n=1 Tax=Marinobacter persicus TaxID=930118 RepID=A0A1I3TYC0_9GAMM|nr:alpha/beta hydrolase [Marinobacter persicus]GHD45723.1 alpha/beta hydrolase [Marinobacter persicus]SFJ74656.1 Pimeloyl-ACP methyl ester carboxylesterase [Marinobacter persicus]
MTDAVLAAGEDSELAGGRETRWTLKAITLAGIHWRCVTQQRVQPPVLMLHGWLDNAMSFVHLGPQLAGSREVYALDMAGHGFSGHRPEGYSYWLMDYVADLAECIDRYFYSSGQRTVDLVGHSLGGIVCALYAAAFPERVRRLVMIDSLGALSRSADETIPQLRKAIRKRLRGSSPSAVYPDLATAARIRERGFSPLSAEAALTLVSRSMRREGDGWVWRTDPRLRHPSALMMTEEQVQASLAAVKTPALFIKGEDGLLSERQNLSGREHLIPGLTIAEVPGGHHCHLDGDPLSVATAIERFFADA